MVELQVALDLLSVPDAMTIAEEAAKGGATWLEVGTPLLKNHGMTALKKIKGAFPDLTVIADMKTMDTGDLEVEIAAKNGADVVSILALAEDVTVKRAVNQGKAHGIRIMGDLMGVKDIPKRARELEELGVDFILIHTPLDVQKVKEEKVDASLKVLRAVKKTVAIPIAVAGGITVESAPYLREAGADIFVVGRAITKAKDVEATTRDICKAIGMKVGPGDAKITPTPDEMTAQYERLPTPFISDAMKRFGAMRGLTPMMNGKRIAGPAFTVRTLGGDWGKVVKAVDAARKGDIIVVDAQGVQIAVWGELATRSAMQKGIKGIIIDGAARDSDDIKELGFPVWSRYVVPNAGEPHGHGEMRGPVACGGQTVNTGDMIIADEVGVVVVPRERAAEILQKSKEIAKKETRYKDEIEKGKTLSEIFGL